MGRALYWMQATGLRTLLRAVAPLPLSTRQEIIARAAAGFVRVTPAMKRRAERNLDLVFPEMGRLDRDALVFEAARNVGRTLTGIWFNADLAHACADLPATGPGLQALRDAKADGRPAIIVSGHFGQWEALRHILMREGLETGALYRPNNNPYYEPIFRAGIERGGAPIIPRGAQGFRQMLRHLKAGGFMALLPDQKMRDGEDLDFLGHPARTPLAAAELALRYDAVLVPAFAPWIDGRPAPEFEMPIPPSDPRTMMADFNARLGSRVRQHPSQWHWFHRRWKVYR
ncbi:lysophospholipid acyltransferase family protein [Jannaschia aquimarina]|nr:lysophospholipid acyltransferase family protein [Jannaschia aquimarina]